MTELVEQNRGRDDGKPEEIVPASVRRFPCRTRRWDVDDRLQHVQRKCSNISPDDDVNGANAHTSSGVVMVSHSVASKQNLVDFLFFVLGRQIVDFRQMTNVSQNRNSFHFHGHRCSTIRASRNYRDYPGERVLWYFLVSTE